MDVFLKRIICEILKQAGFDSVESKALTYFIDSFEESICVFLRTSLQLSLHAGRPSTSLLDVFGINKSIQRIKNNSLITPEQLMECNATIIPSSWPSISNLFSIIPFTRPHIIYEEIEIEPDWQSSISSKVEKFIHIYDFMPSFPPIHTFRITMPKASDIKNQSSKVKHRLEQSLRSEGNMIKLVKSSGSVPGFINYLYKNKN